MRTLKYSLFDSPQEKLADAYSSGIPAGLIILNARRHVNFRMPHSGIPAAVLRVVREPDHLRDHEQAVQAGVRRRGRLLADKGELDAVRQQCAGWCRRSSGPSA